MLFIVLPVSSTVHYKFTTYRYICIWWINLWIQNKNINLPTNMKIWFDYKLSFEWTIWCVWLMIKIKMLFQIFYWYLCLNYMWSLQWKLKLNTYNKNRIRLSIIKLYYTVLVILMCMFTSLTKLVYILHVIWTWINCNILKDVL